MSKGLSGTLAASTPDQRSMAWADIAILGIIGGSTLLSLFRGFVREAFALGGWIAGIWIGFSFMHVGAGWFARWFESQLVQLTLGFLVLLAGVLVLAGLSARVVAGLVDAAHLGALDRLLGMFFGAGRGALLVAGLVVLAGFAGLPQEGWLQESALLPGFEAFAGEIEQVLPAEIAQYVHR